MLLYSTQTREQSHLSTPRVAFVVSLSFNAYNVRVVDTLGGFAKRCCCGGGYSSVRNEKHIDRDRDGDGDRESIFQGTV